MFKILLINPPRDHVVSLHLPGFVDLGEISSFPPIGLMYLAEALRQSSPENHVTIIDSVADKLDYHGLVKEAMQLKPDIIGLTSFSYTFYDVLATAKALKQSLRQIPIVVGGPHMFIFGPETMTHDCFDYGVVGDGERVFSDLCASIRTNAPFLIQKGLLYRQNGHIEGGGVAQVQDLDAIKIPALDLIDPYKYYSTVGKGRAVGTICSSRGCPFRCTFCQVPRTSYRMRSIANIISEIERYLEKGISDIFFFDDLFNITKQRVVDFSRKLLRRNLQVSWMFRGRVDQIDLETMTWARKAGCHTVSVGVEDATDEGLRAIRKNIKIEQAYAAVKAIRQSGVRCSTNWIIGFPHHRSLDDLNQLLSTAIKLDSDYAQFSILQCLPGSELYDQAVLERGLDPNAWSNYVLSPHQDFSPPIWEHHLTQKQLFDAYGMMYRKYYMRPKFIIREAWATRSRSELRRKIDAFRKIFLRRQT